MFRRQKTVQIVWPSSFSPKASACATCRLRNEAGRSLRFIDLHRKVLTFRTSARPFRRCLVFQARFAAKQALAEGRFNEQQLAEMTPYLVSVSPQASNIEVRDECCGVRLMRSAKWVLSAS